MLVLFLFLSLASCALDFDEGIRGVCLGSWFVVEFFMVPSLFGDTGALSEYSLTEALGKEKSRKLLEKHWDTFIQESDFRQISDWGFNAVRIPIGYWAFLEVQGEPYVQGQIPYLDRAIRWAQKYGIQVMIDLHVPAGGFSNFDAIGAAGTPFIESPKAINYTIETLQRIVDRYNQPSWNGAVSAVEVNNEIIDPANALGAVLLSNMTESQFLQTLDSYYSRALAVIPENITAVMNQFETSEYQFSAFSDVPNAAVDYHNYDISIDVLSPPSVESQAEAICSATQTETNELLPFFIGEFSATRSECERVFSVFSSFPGCEGVNNISSAYWYPERREDYRRYVETQLDVYEKASKGWFFWSYKTEEAITIDLRKVIDYGLFPMPLDDRKYSPLCALSNTATNSTSTSNTLQTSTKLPLVSTRSSRSTKSPSRIISSVSGMVSKPLSTSNGISSRILSPTPSLPAVSGSRRSSFPPIVSSPGSQTKLFSHAFSERSPCPSIASKPVSTNNINSFSGSSKFGKVSQSSPRSSSFAWSWTPGWGNTSTLHSASTMLSEATPAIQLTSSSYSHIAPQPDSSARKSESDDFTESAVSFTKSLFHTLALLSSISAATHSTSNPIGGVTLPTVTSVVSSFTTVCPSSTKFTVNGATYTATGSETITVTDCPCTITSVNNVASESMEGSFGKKLATSEPPLDESVEKSKSVAESSEMCHISAIPTSQSPSNGPSTTSSSQPHYAYQFSAPSVIISNSAAAMIPPRTLCIVLPVIMLLV